MTVLDRFGDEAQGVFRVIVGLAFMQHGAQKLFGWLGGFGGVAGARAELLSQMGTAGVLEFFGGLLIVLGLLTRGAAVVLFFEMVVAYLLAHFPQGTWPIQNGGELAILYGSIWFFFAANGPGWLSVDRALGWEPPRPRSVTVQL